MACCKKPDAGFYQWETADLVIELDREGVLSDTKDVIVSIAQGAKHFDYHKDELLIDEEANAIGLHFSQEDAGELGASSAAVQVNILYNSGERDVSEVGTIGILSNLYKQVME